MVGGKTCCGIPHRFQVTTTKWWHKRRGAGSPQMEKVAGPGQPGGPFAFWGTTNTWKVTGARWFCTALGAARRGRARRAMTAVQGLTQRHHGEGPRRGHRPAPSASPRAAANLPREEPQSPAKDPLQPPWGPSTVSSSSLTDPVRRENGRAAPEPRGRERRERGRAGAVASAWRNGHWFYY